MLCKSEHAEEVTVKVSGKDTRRLGAEAFVFIQIDGWLAATHGKKADGRNAVMQKILRDVWKSLTTTGQGISAMKTIMTLRSDIASYWRNWNPPVDYMLHDRYDRTSELDRLATVIFPTSEPIVHVSVNDDPKQHSIVMNGVERYSKIIAMHKLTYPDVMHIHDMARKMYKRDPEGEVMVWKDPRKPSGLLYLEN